MSKQYNYLNLPLILSISLIMVVAMVGCGTTGSSTSSPPPPSPSVAPDAAHIVFSPNTLDFGSVPVGVQKTSSVTVSNSKGSSGTISQITATGTGFSVVASPPLPLVLAAGQSSTLTVAFTPQSAGSTSGSLSVVISGSTSSITEALSGAGTAPVAAGQLGISPSSMAFGSVALGSSQNQTGSLTAGSSSITVSSASWNGAGYSLSGITFPVTVPAGQSVPFVVTFAPQTANSSAGSVSFVSNASNSPANVTMSGSGLQLAHSVSLSWNASSSSVVGYKIYRGTISGGPYTLVNTALQPGTTYSDNSVQSGKTYFYVTTAVDGSAQESAFSNESMAVIPTP